MILQPARLIALAKEAGCQVTKLKIASSSSSSSGSSSGGSAEQYTATLSVPLTFPKAHAPIRAKKTQ